ncbi:MAG: Zn-ribbon containing protein [Candidatus Aenigmatarchaeota archaeon]
MSHKCLRCGKVYDDNDPQIINGCTCGSIFFFFIKDKVESKKLEEIEKTLNLQRTTLEAELEKEFIKVATGENNFGIETIKNPKDGVYEINIDALMKRQPLIILRQGKTYLIHLPSVFEKVRERH